VINVDWNDAKEYTAWLSKLTGKSYRLLSEAEYEYATRAGTQTVYPWGNDITLDGTAMANCRGCGGHLNLDGEKTTPVDSFAPDGFGLYDMVGNVQEWTEDCYHDSYNGAPADGSAQTDGKCDFRVQRGGSWIAEPYYLRSAYRTWGPIRMRQQNIGFRVGRTLNP
jgi:formylglycine-generating enzyme required for sulfatase activity